MTATDPTRVTVPIEDVLSVLHGPLNNDEYMGAVGRLWTACLDAAEAAGPAPDEDDDTNHEGLEVPF